MKSTPHTANARHHLSIQGARQHNLKNLTVDIPHNALTVITGVSGSGKSSLAFDTVFAEGQWRYVESLSSYSRMFIEKLDRPDVDALINIRPAIAIEQKNPVRTARSTVGTSTEIADLLRVLFAKISKPTCPNCLLQAQDWNPQTIYEDLLTRYSTQRAMILFPLPHPGVEQLPHFIQSLMARGFIRLYNGREVVPLHPQMSLSVPEEQDLYIVLDRLVIRSSHQSRIMEGLETAIREGKGRCRVDVIGAGTQLYQLGLHCPKCGEDFPSVRPIFFSFNHPLGACQDCKGFGNILRYDPQLVIPDPTRSLADGAIEPWSKPGTDWWQQQMLLAMKRRGVRLSQPYQELPEDIRHLLWTGDRKFDGIQDFFEHLEQKRYKLHVRVFLSRYRSPTTCSSCSGARLKPSVLHRKIAGASIHDLSQLTIADLRHWSDQLRLTPFEQSLAKDLLKRLGTKLNYLLRVGLGYLTLSRQTRTLSGGEAQRILLANQLGAQLTGTLYVLDEPTIGLHACDTATLIEILHELRNAGNTLLVVEHDQHMIHAADHVIELGPRAGEQGGELVSALSTSKFLRAPQSLTAQYLRGEKQIPLPSRRRDGTGQTLAIAGACEHNLKNLLIKIPLGMLVCITGVSGSGKSTVADTTLYRAVARAFRIETLPIGRFTAIRGLEHLTGVKMIDQSPIGRTPRSNPITYLKGFDEIRQLFAHTPQARRQGLQPAHFSFNTTGGRCEQCQGSGQEKLEMYFFEDMFVTCESCQGKRFRADVLNVTYRRKSIDQVLAMTVDDAQAFFSGSPKIGEKLHTLQSIGLGYLRLGQPASTLSGGEAQRLKIAAELKLGHARRRPGSLFPSRSTTLHSSQRPEEHKGLLYILDEPTTGLHFENIKQLLEVLHRLVEDGNTIVLVEHNLDVIKSADWIIDLGPEGGDQGGTIVAEGRPEEIISTPTSTTGRFLKPYLVK